MLYIQFSCPLYHPGGDSDMDYYMARYILNLPGSNYIQAHSPGMALFLIATGVVSFNTWYGLIVAYAAMSVAIPCFIYASLRQYSVNCALAISLVVIFSFIPYVYSRLESYDQLFLFMEFLSVYLIAKHFQRPSKSYFAYFIAASIFFLNLVKPEATFLFFIYLFVTFFVKSINRNALYKALALYMGLMTVWVGLEWGGGRPTLAHWYNADSLAQRRFGQIYFQPNHYFFNKFLAGQPVITSNDGKASQKLYAIVRDYAVKYNQLWGEPNHSVIPKSTYPYYFYGRFANSPSALVAAIFKYPNAFYGNFIWDAVSDRLNHQLAKKLLLDVAAEHQGVGLVGFMSYILQHPGQLITGPDVSMGWRNLLAVYTYLAWRKTREADPLFNINKLPNSLLDSKLGPYSKEYFSGIHFFVQDLQPYWNHLNYVFDKFSGHPENLYEAIKNPGSSFGSSTSTSINGADISIVEGWYYTYFMSIYGPSLTNKLFFHVFWETAYKYPDSLMLLVDNFLDELFFNMHLKDVDQFSVAHLIAVSPVNFLIKNNETAGITQKLAHELKPIIVSDKFHKYIAFAYELMHWAAPVFVLISILTIMLLFRSQERYFVLFLMLVFLYYVCVFALFGNFGDQRYSDIFIFLPVIISFLAIKNLFYVVTKKVVGDGHVRDLVSFGLD